MVEILQLVHEIAVFRRCSIKEVFWKTENSQITQEAVMLRCSVKRKDVLKNFAKFTQKHFSRSLFYNQVAGCKTETFRSSHWRSSVKQGVLKKITLTQVFSCEFCPLFKNTCFVEDQQTGGSETPGWPGRECLFNKVASLVAWSSLVESGRDFSTGIFLWIF